MVKPCNVEDYRRLAAKRLPRMVFDYLDGGAESERGLRRNRAAFEAICFEPRRLIDVSRRDLSVEMFGRKYPMPLVIAPTGLNGALWPDGDVLLARAAAEAGIPFPLSTASNATIEEVADRAGGGELWFQLYIVQRALAEALTKRALAVGYKTLVLTVDVPVNGKRERDMRNGFGVPFRYSPRVVLDSALHPGWSLRQLRHGLPELANFAGPVGGQDVNAQAALMNRQMDASFAWDDLKALRDSWPHTLLVKGLLCAEDAELCVRLGIDGVIVSNHGARQLEDVAAPVETLADFTARTDRPVLVDSGFRRGADVVKALALGARAVLLGRATLYGLAARGGAGIADVLRILRQEIDTTLALIGCARAAELGPAFIRGGGTANAEVTRSAAEAGQLSTGPGRPMAPAGVPRCPFPWIARLCKPRCIERPGPCPGPRDEASEPRDLAPGWRGPKPSSRGNAAPFSVGPAPHRSVRRRHHSAWRRRTPRHRGGPTAPPRSPPARRGRRGCSRASPWPSRGGSAS